MRATNSSWRERGCSRLECRPHLFGLLEQKQALVTASTVRRHNLLFKTVTHNTIKPHITFNMQ